MKKGLRWQLFLFPGRPCSSGRPSRIARYQRFFAEVRLEREEIVSALAYRAVGEPCGLRLRGRLPLVRPLVLKFLLLPPLITG